MDEEKEDTETTWIKVGEEMTKIVERLIQQQDHDDRVERLRRALEEVE